ncbi:permease-like cell division protein FtsX [Gorillibacterium sp. sgz5001074]|uniref:permease-like cell division protein FtsX n=1 Tax=Gorillibacterium sp. sgz5001074 TaxID=3446695 RepID=UPI003F672027
MKISTIGRHFREGTRSLIRNGWMTFASISAISISLFVLGIFLLLAVNVNYMSSQVENQVEVKVYLDVNLPQENVAKLRTEMEAIGNVDEVIFVSKEEGLKLMRERMGETGEKVLEGMDGENNPLNDAFTVRVKDPHAVKEVADAITALNNGRTPKPIVKVNYGADMVENLFKVTSMIRNVGLVLVGCLALTAMFLISNTIKLTIMARNREIKIMKLVGATNSFIRWPFFIEGAMLGIIGSVIPAAILSLGYWKLIETSRSSMETFMMEMKPFDAVYLQLSAILIGIGIGIGIWGSMLSVRKYLRA